MAMATAPSAKIDATTSFAPPPGGSASLDGSFTDATLVVRPPARRLALALTPLLVEPALPARLGRPRLASRARHMKGAAQPLAEPLEGGLAISRLPAGVLRDGGHARPAARHDSPLLVLAECGRGGDIEHGLDPRSG